MNRDEEFRIQMVDGTTVAEISYSCGKVLEMSYFLMFSISGTLLVSLNGFLPALFGILFLCVSMYAGWLLFSNRKCYVNLETGKGSLNSRRFRGGFAAKAFSIRDFNRVFVHSRRRPLISWWTVTLSDVHGRSFVLAPCVQREQGIAIAQLMADKFGLKNNGVVG